MIKKKSILTYVLAFMLIIPTMFMLTACGEHKHSYTNEWSMSATEHWHACTDENCTEKQDVAEHTFGEWTITKAATTTSTGEKYRTCSTCGYRETAIIGMVQAYTITWKNADGTILETDLEVLEGSKPEYNGATPTKVEDAVGSWEFKGWKVGDEIVDLSSYNITQNTTFVAEFEVDTYKTYTITFVNDDGTTITTKIYHYNDTIDASDITPTKASSAQYNYTFSGWSPALSNVKGNVTYTAQYTSEERTYTITFVDERDTSIVFATQTYKYGETIDTSGITPTRETDKYARYTFAYWSPSLTADTKVTGDTTYRAVFSREYIYYTVKFIDWDGTEISSGSYYITQELTIPKNPTREADNTYTYNFDKWVDANGRTFNSSSCQGETVYTATYTQNYINYTVKFVDYNDTTLSIKTNYHYGDTVTAPTTPTRDADNTYTYTFAGWGKEITTVTGNTTYKATYKEAYINYTIKFVDENGTTILSEKTDYHYGDTVTEPTTPTKASDETYSYTFAGWDKTVVNCAGNATYKATYTANKIDYVITFNMDGGSGGTESATAHYGEDMPTATAPTKSQSEFKGYYDEDGVRYYDSEMNSVRTFDKTQNLTLTAKWSIIWAYTDETKTSIYFGYYPQTKVTDDTLISALNKLAGYNPNSGYLGNWTSYGYYEYGKVSDFMFYIDIDYDSDGSYDYRGVYFETYRAYTPAGSGGGAVSDYSQLNGYIRQTKYWFKYEPIKWNILAEADGYATVLADLLLDSQNFDFTSSTDYSSNYAESTIRAWLNSNFYNTAFTAMQKELIQTVTVDNSAETNIDYSTTEVTATPCENTEDKIWLLSYQEAKTYSAIVKKTSTDYAKCQGINANVYNETYNGYSAWWLRSPQSDTYSYTVAETGVTTANAVPVQYTSIGVLPALKVKLA